MAGRAAVRQRCRPHDGVSVSAASHHLRKVRDPEILEYRNDAKMAYHSLRARLAAGLVDKALSQAKS